MKDETKFKLLLLHSKAQVLFSRLVRGFNRKVDGVAAEYDLRYAESNSRLQTLDLMRPVGKSGLPCVIYLHGGGWAAYDKRVFRSTCKRFAACGAAVLNCNFRLAPENKVEDMLEDISSVIAFLDENAGKWGVDAGRLIFSGDSSGAHLLALYLNRAVKAGDPIAKRVKGCAYFYGAFDLTKLDGLPSRKFKTYSFGVFPRYMPSRTMYLYGISPMYSISAGLPPHILFSGEIDCLHASQSAEYLKRLRAAGVRAEALFFPASFKKAKHRFITFDKNPAARQSFDRFALFLQSL